jgi:hypothetical protein
MCLYRLAHRFADPVLPPIVLSSTTHAILGSHNFTMCCPARQHSIGVANNYAHR